MSAPFNQPLESIRSGDYWAYGIGLRATCECGRVRILSGAVIVKEFGQEWRYGEGRLAPLAEKLACQNCGRHRPKLELGQFD